MLTNFHFYAVTRLEQNRYDRGSFFVCDDTLYDTVSASFKRQEVFVCSTHSKCQCGLIFKWCVENTFVSRNYFPSLRYRMPSKKNRRKRIPRRKPMSTRKYANNAINRALGRVGRPIATTICVCKTGKRKYRTKAAFKKSVLSGLKERMRL